MLNLSQAFHRARTERNQRPILLLWLINAFGARVYSERQVPEELAGIKSASLADGSWLADGARGAGSEAMSLLDRGGLVLSFGRLRETLTPLRGEIAASYGQEEPGSLTVVLANSFTSGQSLGRFAHMEAVENLLGAAATLMVGYPGLQRREFCTRFTGRVEAYRLEQDKIALTLRAA